LQEVERRLARALELMEDVIAALAPHDADTLSDVEKAQLEAGYLYRGDCLFDLGRYAAAIEAYREAAWRFENRPAAVSATLQIVQCHQRLGQAEEARSALARLGWLLKKTPASAFDERKGMRPKALGDVGEPAGIERGVVTAARGAAKREIADDSGRDTRCDGVDRFAGRAARVVRAAAASGGSAAGAGGAG
jgi:tetratricopeptide (TPR) repeat protein